MSLTKADHTVVEINGTRCSLIESGIEKERMEFLKKLLEHNKYEVKLIEKLATEEGVSPLYDIAVTDVTFEAVIAVYERRLRTLDGHRVTPAYWRQQAAKPDPQYWVFGK